MPRTSLRTCDAGHRIVWALTQAGEHQALDWAPSDLGTIAAYCDHLGTWHARTLSQGEQPVPPEKRFQCHWTTHPQCRPLSDRQRAQRADAVTAVRTTLRRMRRERNEPEPTLFQETDRT
jgi:hypothetical protein